jgi:hypothetical protein
VAHFSDWNELETGFRTTNYLKFHEQRYRLLLGVVSDLAKTVRSEPERGSLRLLDIGPSFQTELLRNLLPDATIDTLGFLDARFSPRPHETHTELNLNELQTRERWPRLDDYHIIVLAEVIEHLHVAPEIVLGYLRSILTPGGYLVVQTPNAVSLAKRLRMLSGRNPYKMLKPATDDPGHFREYTINELTRLGASAGLRTVSYVIQNYFWYGRKRGRLGDLYNSVCQVLPPTLRDGITISYLNPAASAAGERLTQADASHSGHYSRSSLPRAPRRSGRGGPGYRERRRCSRPSSWRRVARRRRARV